MIGKRQSSYKTIQITTILRPFSRDMRHSKRSGEKMQRKPHQQKPNDIIVYNNLTIRLRMNEYGMKTDQNTTFLPWKGLMNTSCFCDCLACHEGCASSFLNDIKGLFQFTLFLLAENPSRCLSFDCYFSYLTLFRPVFLNSVL